MVIFRLLLLPLLLSLTQCSAATGTIAADYTASQVANTIGKRHHITPCALGGESKEGKKSYVIANFEYRGDAIDFNRGRKMVVELAQDYLVEFNRQINPENVYFYPFEMKDISISIYCSDSLGKDYMDPYVNILACRNGRVSFFTQDPDNSLKTKQLIKEPYEEALKKIKESAP